VGVDPTSGEVSCAADIDTDSLAQVQSCQDGQSLVWRQEHWTCASGPAPDYAVFGSCTNEGDKVVGVDSTTGEVICGADVDTDTDSLADVGACNDGQLLEWQGGAWTCATPSVVDEATVDGWVANNGYATVAVQNEVVAARGGEGSLDARLAASDARMAAMEARLADLEAAECPPGLGFAYEVAADGFPICTRPLFGAPDEMVRVGDYWIDRYESNACGVGVLGGPTGGDEMGGATTEAWACSRAATNPQASITWFQAAQMCANAGKRLCTNAEWQTAVSGTPDPGATTEDGDCNVSLAGPVNTGSQSLCVSRFGAYDMVGNLREWVADWHGKDSATNELVTSATYGDDYMYDVSPADYQGAGQNFPAAAIRGGSWDSGASAGAFALYVSDAPSLTRTIIGARCCAGGR
jgi:formylglycine-generating enzyme required for sulfatase activity